MLGSTPVPWLCAHLSLDTTALPFSDSPLKTLCRQLPGAVVTQQQTLLPHKVKYSAANVGKHNLLHKIHPRETTRASIAVIPLIHKQVLRAITCDVSLIQTHCALWLLLTVKCSSIPMDLTLLVRYRTAEITRALY